jgi:uncharacterized protein YndB with AHSA1/START domain
MNTKHKTGSDTFHLVREFKAPKKLVFNAFSTAEALSEWWGPVATKNTVLKLDFREGGIFHYKMESDGQANYGRFIFGEIKPYDLLEFNNAFADAQGNVVRAPFDINLPAQIFYRLIFSESNGKTILTMTGEAVNGTAEEIAALKSIHDSMQEGFGASFNQLASYLGNNNI